MRRADITYSITLTQIDALVSAIVHCDGPGNTEACSAAHQIPIEVLGPDEELVYQQYQNIGLQEETA